MRAQVTVNGESQVLFLIASIIGRVALLARAVIRLEAVAAPVVGPIAFGAPAMMTRIDTVSVVYNMAARDRAIDNDA